MRAEWAAAVKSVAVKADADKAAAQRAANTVDNVAARRAVVEAVAAQQLSEDVGDPHCAALVQAGALRH